MANSTPATIIGNVTEDVGGIQYSANGRPFLRMTVIDNPLPNRETGQRAEGVAYDLVFFDDLALNLAGSKIPKGARIWAIGRMSTNVREGTARDGSSHVYHNVSWLCYDGGVSARWNDVASNVVPREQRQAQRAAQGQNLDPQALQAALQTMLASVLGQQPSQEPGADQIARVLAESAEDVDPSDEGDSVPDTDPGEGTSEAPKDTEQTQDEDGENEPF